METDNKSYELTDRKPKPTKERNMDDFENTMKVDFEDLQFNKYLDDQPGFILDDGRRCKIIITNVLRYYSRRAIRNLCGEFGEVCSVKGPLQMNNKSGYLFYVIFGTIDDAQHAIEQINRMCKPMRADFSKPRNSTPQFSNTRFTDQVANKDESIPFKSEIRKLQVPLIEKFDFEFPKRKQIICMEEYISSDLAKNDPKLVFLNDIALCDILKTEDDIRELQSISETHQLDNFIWSYMVPKEDETRINRFLSNSTGFYDETYEVHFKRDDKFDKLLGKFDECKNCCNLTTRTSKLHESFFCSIACQKQSEDKNPFIEDRKTIEDFCLPIIEISHNTNVVITAVIGQNIIYVRPSDLFTTTRYYQVLQEVSEKCQDAPIVMKTPKPGDLIGVETTNENIYRAMVLKAESSKKIRVVFLDTGEVSFQTRAKFRKLPQSLWLLPIYVSKVVLSDVQTSYFNLNAVKFLSKIAFGQEQRELLIKFEENAKAARLYQKNVCINTELRRIIEIRKTGEKHFYVEDLPFFPQGGKQLVILDNSMMHKGELSCVALEYFEKLDNLQQKVQSYGKSLKLKADHMYTPSYNELSLVRINNVWYRATCVETVGDQHPTMQSIDFGFFTAVHISNIVELPRNLLDCSYTHDYCINDIEKYSELFKDTHLKYFQQAKEKLSLGKIINVENIIKKDEGELYLESREVQLVFEELKEISNAQIL